MTSAIDEINLRMMRSDDTVEFYLQPTTLLPHDQAALNAVSQEVRSGSVLDIGVGAGRSVRALTEFTTNYLGIDYSEPMVAACRKRYPAVRFELADARELRTVADNSMSFVVFSCNGISMVGHDDRLQILREVHRVLKADGVFLFSTYNRDSAEATQGFRLEKFPFSSNPLRLLVRSARWTRDSLRSYRQRSRNVKFEIHAADYAVLNDRCHNYGVMLYYITIGNQRKQLENAGFRSDALVFDADGRVDARTCTHDTMAFVAQKA